MHPPNYKPTLGWGSLHRFQIFKQNWNISISSSAIEFWMIPGVPPGGGGWVDGGGGGERVHPTHVHTHAHARMHTCAYDIIGNSPNGGSHLHEIIMFTTCACACVHVHACAHVWRELQGCREPKTPKFNKSWTNRDNSILFEDSLPLNIPELI